MDTATPLEDSVHTWEARDGTPVCVRPIQPGDFELERAFVEGLSPRTGYQRLMNPRKPSTAELQRWTRVDRTREGVLIATVSHGGAERQIGVARYALEAEDGQEGDAEFAIVIADAWQGTGLGLHLLSCLIELARTSGVRRILGTTLSDNVAMLGLARRLGFRRSRMAGAAIYTQLTLGLQAEAQAWP